MRGLLIGPYRVSILLAWCLGQACSRDASKELGDFSCFAAQFQTGNIERPAENRSRLVLVDRERTRSPEVTANGPNPYQKLRTVARRGTGHAESRPRSKAGRTATEACGAEKARFPAGAVSRRGRSRRCPTRGEDNFFTRRTTAGTGLTWVLSAGVY